VSGAAYAERYGAWAVVTGASDGIGLAIARELARRGLNLLLVARRAERLRDAAAALRARHGVECLPLAADLATPEGCSAVAEAAAPLDVGLYVAAAGFGSSGAFIDSRLETERGMLAVNCGAVLDLGLHFARRLARRGRGGIVLMSSLVAFQGAPRSAHYAATKAWVQTLAEGLCVELRPLGVDVLASAPGPVHSGFAARADMRMDRASDPDTVARETLDALGRRGTVRPGGLSKLLGWSLATLPRALRVQVLARVMAGMTAHHAGGAPA